jgi:hypothetical protein
VKKQKKNTKT